MGGERRGGSQRSEQDAGQHGGRAVASEAPGSRCEGQQWSSEAESVQNDNQPKTTT